MFRINENSNNLEAIRKVTFKELGFKERDHLQEWIRKNPNCLEEDLLIIQKEFSGFNDTNERLDLLALDKKGNLVIIENKLDDSGRDVTWQVLKYASYCSSLDYSNIISIFNDYLSTVRSSENALDILEDFFETDDFEEIISSSSIQRIIMVSGTYRKEVTSTVLWLINNYGLRIQCYKATPYKMGEEAFVNFEQVIPMRDAEDFIISMAQKNRASIEKKAELQNRHYIRIEFWKLMLNEINDISSLFVNIKPSKDSWIAAGAGMSGVTYNLVCTGKYIRIELCIWGKTQEENKIVFDLLENHKDKIETKFTKSLVWERMSNKRMSRVKFETTDLSIFNKDDWPKMIEFVKENISQFEKSFQSPLQDVNKQFKLKNTK